MNRRMCSLLAVAILAGGGLRGDVPARENSRTPVVSSSVASIGYDARLRELEVEFRSGSVYRYADVPETVFREFARAESKGQFFSQKIRGKFSYRRLGRNRP